jgi:PTS system ascorbate-specific IIA component
MSRPADRPPVGLLVIAHAPFAQSLFDCAQHVFACGPERCVVLDIVADADVAAELARARAAVAEVDRGTGVLVLTDLFGATPGNIAAQLADPGRVEVVAGVNLPMLLRVLCYRQGTLLADMPEKAVAGGVSGIIKIASTSPQNQRLFPHDPNDGPAGLQDQ